MNTVQRFFSILCDVLIFLGLLGFIAPPFSYGKNSPPPTSQDDTARGQGDEHQTDRCDHLPNPPGNAKGIDKKCLPGGSSSGIAKGDFNGDGFADLAIGVPDEDTPATQPDAGAVIVIYGSANGLTTTDPTVPASQFWSQNSPGVPGSSEAGDRFGSALAAGDFNGDGFSDLAIGAAGEDIVLKGVSNFKNLGAVTVIYGSENGLTTTNPPVAAQFWDETDFNEFARGRLVLAEEDSFGSALAWGDFNHDGIGDLAIGIPNKNLFIGLPNDPLLLDRKVGAVTILYGSQNNGLTLLGHQVWSQDGPIGGGAEDGDRFGAALAAGDFNGDTFSDLAVGVPGEDVNNNSVKDAGAVNIIFGSSSGLTSTGNQFWSQESNGIASEPLADEEFGSALATGDFNGDKKDDLAIGVPGQSLGEIVIIAGGGQNVTRTTQNAGAVHIIPGSSTGLTASGSQFWNQDRIFGSGGETGDVFGRALAAGDFNADGKADLAIGVPSEDVGSVNNAGEVDVIYGSTSIGLSPAATQAPQRFQDSTLEADAEFGRGLTAWNFGRNEKRILPPDNFTVEIKTADLAIGIPFKDVSGQNNAGAVSVLYGSAFSNGLTTSDSQLWTQDSPNVPGAAESGDHFGSALY